MRIVIKQIAILLLIAHVLAQAPATNLPKAKPKPAPARWRGLIGEYGPATDILYILEKDAKLCASFKRAEPETLQELSPNSFAFPEGGPHTGQRLEFTRARDGRATHVKLNNVTLERRQIEPEAGAKQLRVAPVRPIPELLKEALTAQPPPETGDFRKPELIELTTLDPTIKLEIRYATTNNLFGAVFYAEP